MSFCPYTYARTQQFLPPLGAAINRLSDLKLITVTFCLTKVIRFIRKRSQRSAGIAGAARGSPRGRFYQELGLEFFIFCYFLNELKINLSSICSVMSPRWENI